MVPIRCGAVAPDAVRRRVPRDANMRYPMGALGRGCRGLSPPRMARDRRRAIGSAGERLVHTEEVTGSIPVSPTRSEAMWIFMAIRVGAIPVAKLSAWRYAPPDIVVSSASRRPPRRYRS
jgi:hypothetical protein